MSGSKRRGDEAILYVCVSVWVCLKERRDTTKWIGRQEARQRALPEVKLCPVSVTKSHLSHTNTHTQRCTLIFFLKCLYMASCSLVTSKATASTFQPFLQHTHTFSTVLKCLPIARCPFTYNHNNKRKKRCGC